MCRVELGSGEIFEIGDNADVHRVAHEVGASQVGIFLEVVDTDVSAVRGERDNELQVLCRDAFTDNDDLVSIPVHPHGDQPVGDQRERRKPRQASLRPELLHQEADDGTDSHSKEHLAPSKPQSAQKDSEQSAVHRDVDIGGNEVE